MGSISPPRPATPNSEPSLYYHEYQPDFEKQRKETEAFLRGKSYMKAPRPLRIIVIGAGASSLALAREVNEGRIANATLIVYEKNAGVGGTWWENRYEGCACDIPSHNYQYTWAPNTDWSEYYSKGSEIKHYFEAVADQYDLNKYVKLSQEIVKAQWNEKTHKWEVQVRSRETGDIINDSGDILINGGGIVNNWKWPNIQGLKSYKGEKMHSAAWNEKYSFKDKNVVLIGNGSSGVQITAALGKDTEEQKKAWRDNPQLYLEYRKSIEQELTKRQNWIMKGSKEQGIARDFSYKQMKQGLAAKPELIEKLIPSFDVGCRRPTPGNGYLETLTQSNVDVSWGSPQRFTEHGIILHDGVEVKPDVVICATGFDLSYKPRFPILGREEVDLGDYWGEEAKAYMSLAIPNFPNYLHYLGPATAASHGSLIPAIEQLTKYFVQVINKLQREGYSTFEPLEKCVEALDKHHQEFLSHTVWDSHCTSTFKNGTAGGRINLLHGGTRLHHFAMMQEPRWEDYNWTLPAGAGLYDYFGNGRSVQEDLGGDTSWYIDSATRSML